MSEQEVAAGITRHVVFIEELHHRIFSWYETVFSSCSCSQHHRQMRAELLSFLRSMADLSNAIHWMPPGFLWAGKFPSWLVGLMGTISSVIGLIQMANSEQASDT